MRVEWSYVVDEVTFDILINLPTELRETVHLAERRLVAELTATTDPISAGSLWNATLRLWVHDVPPMRYYYQYTEGMAIVESLIYRK